MLRTIPQRVLALVLTAVLVGCGDATFDADGRVVDSAGAPVSGASVTLEATVDADLRGYLTKKTRKTDGDGKFHIGFGYDAHKVKNPKAKLTISKIGFVDIINLFDPNEEHGTPHYSRVYVMKTLK